MFDLRPVLYVVGLMLCALAAVMILPALADAADHRPEWEGFAASAGITAFFGGTLALTNMRAQRFVLNLRQGFILTTASWLAVAVFAAIPLMFVEPDLGYANAFFEVVSGLTTTGATVLVGLDSKPAGILLWRALLQGIGGVGIVVMAILILPFLRIGGMQLFHLESSDRSERVVPRAGQLMVYIAVAYWTLTFVCAFLFWLAGMSWFDAICHAMATLSTGGFSTHDVSFGQFLDPPIHWIAIAFMIAGSLPFVLIIKCARGDWLAIARDSQARSLVVMLAVVSGVLATHLWANLDVPLAEALRLAAFNITSIVSTTGFVSADYGLWGPAAVALFFMLLFVGGCSGSTAGAIKIYRFQVLWTLARGHLLLLLDPRRVIVPTYAGRPMPGDVPTAILAFVTVYVASVALLGFALSIIGLDFLTSMSAAATAIGNVGPGLGPIIGPAGTFTPLPDTAKWLLSFGMLLGRLEFFTILVLLEPQFWRR